MGDRHEPAPVGAAEVDDPAVVRAAVCGRELRIAHETFPGDPDRRVEQHDVDPLGVHDAQAGMRIVAARRAALLVAALPDRHEIGGVHPDAAERPEAAAERGMRTAVDEEDFDAVGVALDPDRAIAELRIEVALPGVARLEHVPVRVDGDDVESAIRSSHAPGPYVQGHATVRHRGTAAVASAGNDASARRGRLRSDTAR